MRTASQRVLQRVMPTRSELVRVFLLAVVVNFAWEMAQSPLYSAMDGWRHATLWCFRASIGDAAIVAVLMIVGAVFFCRGDWFRRPDSRGYAFMAIAGSVIATAIELHALRTDRWAYDDRMIVLPVLHVGLTPLLQMIVVPPAVCRLARARG